MKPRTPALLILSPLLCAACSGGGFQYYGVTDGGTADLTIGPPRDLAHAPGADLATPPPSPDLAVGASCQNGVKDGAETDVDCGGGACHPCAGGQGCVRGSDCASQVCTNQMCTTPTCNDAIKNQGETDVDCGGPCSACSLGKSCLIGTDCQTGICTNNVCAQSPCMDGRKDGQETDVDCGGPQCGPCGNGRGCSVGGDCQSGNCAGGVCAGKASCFDGVKNQDETDIDCGGLTCGACGNGSTCKQNADCTSFGCSFGLCCGAGTANCDGSKNNGCEVNLSSDKNNCGSCNSPCGNGQICSNSQCANVGNLYWQMGVQKSVPVANLTGWTQCFRDTYDQGNNSFANIMVSCSGNKLLAACRPTGSQTLSLLAMGLRADVTFPTGSGNTTHLANGVAWYFDATDPSSSVGFAPSGDAVSRTTCDTIGANGYPAGPDGDSRMCWHTQNGVLTTGFRCGVTTLNGSNTYERLIYQAN